MRMDKKTTNNLYRDLKEAIAGSEQDFTLGSLRRAVFLLAVPMVLEMAMESVFAVVDIYFVSRLGADAVAAVGITESIITIIYAIAVGFSLATTAMVSRRIGEKKPEQAAEAAFQSIITGMFISLTVAVPGVIYAPELLRIMGANADAVGIGVGRDSSSAQPLTLNDRSIVKKMIVLVLTCCMNISLMPTSIIRHPASGKNLW